MTDKEIKIYYPIKYEPRQIQLEALEHTKHNIRRGKKFIMLNLPTGSGKSMFSVMFINWYLNYINEDAKFDILTNSKILQNQYTEEFSFMASLKGKNSYNCTCFKGMTCEEAGEFNKVLKKKCTDCPYDIAKNAWKSNRVALTNFHLFNSVNLFVPELMDEKKPNVLIIDESHTYDEVLCSYISNKISKQSLKLLGFSESNTIGISNSLKSVRNVNDYCNYIEETFIPKLENLMESIENKISDTSIQIKERVKYSKNILNIKSSISNYNSFLNDFKENPNNWVMDIEQTEDKMFYKNYIVQPVWSYPYLEKIIWEKYDHVILMSGTILNKELFSYMNGIDNKLSSYFEAVSPFPIKNRPIYYIKAGKMTYNEKTITWENQKKYIDKIIKRNKDKKGIIHTSSFELSNWVQEYYKDDKRFIFHSSEDREDALYRHMTSKENTIMVSPSLTSGIDFSGKLAEFQIILKIPYPNIKSNKIKKRQEDNKKWYNWMTVITLLQSYGRIVRNETEVGETYVLDSSFSDVLRNSHDLIPRYITDAIKLIKIN